MKKKLYISKETVKTLSSKQLKQVGGGLKGDYGQSGDTCEPLAYAAQSLDICNMV
ncbi:MAG TPA: class I lanthipeptide [Myxococcaceae bacterium]|nr:class I lanthipeptide [Myxococcaceae bacterium]